MGRMLILNAIRTYEEKFCDFSRISRVREVGFLYAGVQDVWRGMLEYVIWRLDVIWQ